MRQWLGETDASSRQIEFVELRPIDRTPATGNSDFRSGPLSPASLGCTLSVIPAIFSPGKATKGKGAILTPTLSRGHWKKSLLMDSVPVRMGRCGYGVVIFCA